MNISDKKCVYVVTMVMAIACLWGINAGLAKKKFIGFYAGPLSVDDKTFVAVKAPKPIAVPQPILQAKEQEADFENPGV